MFVILAMDEISGAISLISFGVSAFLAALLLATNAPRREQWLLASILAIHSLVYLSRYLHVAGSPILVFIVPVASTLAAAMGPLLMRYTRVALFGATNRLARATLVFYGVLPVSVLAAHLLLPVFFVEFRSVRAIQEQRGPVVLATLLIFPAIQIYSSIFILKSFLLIREYVRSFEDQFARDVPARIRWLRAFLGLHLAIYATHFLLILLGLVTDWHFPVTPFEGVVALAMSYLVLYSVIRRPEIFALSFLGGDGPAPRDNSKYSKQNLPEAKRGEYLERVRACMQNEKPYLQEDCNLKELARQLGIPPHHLSMVINIETGQNFFRFVNSYRVSEARRLLSDPASKGTTILDIAYRSGFQSKAAFNQSFKEETGMTPGAYRDRDSSEVAAEDA